MKRKINSAAALLCFAAAALISYKMGIGSGWPWAGCGILAGILHLLLPAESRTKGWKEETCSREEETPPHTPVELVLLNEEGGRQASWEIYGKNGIVIGRDVGENHVTVNLDHTTYAGMIDIEHAVLNFSGDAWYIEDNSSQNGISIQKSDGRKYKISSGKPCRLEPGDIIFVGLTRLQLL